MAVRLRYYQQRAVNAIQQSLAANRSCLCVMATGTGKTEVGAEVVRQWPGNVLWLAHRAELVLQARDRLERACETYVGIEQADTKAAGTERIVVGSVQTVQQKKRLERWPKDHFSLIVFDEAAHAPAPTFRRPMDYFADSKLLGLTATPYRADGKAMGQLFDDAPDECLFDISDAINDGYLVPLDCRNVEIVEIDISTVGKSQGDLAAGELDEVMFRATEGICQETLKHSPDRQGIIFLPGVKSAEYCAARMNVLKQNSTIMVSAKTPPDERRVMFSAFRRGDYQFLANVAIATEGTDLPSVGCVSLARPTLSKALCMQMIGRGTRPLPGVVDPYEMPTMNEYRKQAIAKSAKPDCMILDMVGNHGKHDLMTTVDILGGDYTPAEIKRAKTIARQKKAGYVAKDVLEKARAELREQAARVQAHVKAHSTKFNPFQILGISSFPTDRYRMRFGHEPITHGQREGLKKWGLKDEELNSMSKQEASKMFGELKSRAKKGLASYSMTRTLSRYGILDKNIRWEAGKEAMGYLAATDWGRRGKVDPYKLEMLIRGRRMAGQEG